MKRGPYVVFGMLLAMVLAWGPRARGEDAKPAAPIAVAPADHPGPVNFEKEILPVLNRSCLACHNKTKSKAHLVLETPDDIRKGGSSGPAAIAGRGADSLLLLAASHAKDDLVMPPPDNKVAAPDLTSQQLGLLRLWIDQGAQGQVHDTATISWQALPRALDPVYAVALSADGQFAAWGRANQVFVYHFPTHRMLTALADPSLSKDSTYAGAPVAHRDMVNAIAFSPDGHLMATGGYREVKLWRRETGSRRFAIADAFRSEIRSLATAPDESRFAAGDAEGHIRLFDRDAKPLGECTGHTGAVNGLSFAPDGSKFASVSADGTLRVWSSSDGSPLGFARAKTVVDAVAWADSTRLVSGGEDGTLRVWKVGSDPENPLEIQREIVAHDGPITSLASVPTQQGQILSGSTDGAARVWDLNNGKELRRLVHGAPIVAVAVRPDGKRFASAGSNRVTRLWDADGKLVADMRGDHDAQQNVLARERELATAVSLATFHASALQTAETQRASELAHVKQAGAAGLAADKALAEKQAALSQATQAKAAAEKTAADLNAQIKHATDARDAAEKAAKEAVAAAKSAAQSNGSAAAGAIEEASKKSYAAGQAAATLEETAARVRQPIKDATDKVAAATKQVTELQPPVAAAQAAQAKAQSELESSVRLLQQSTDALAAAKEASRVAQANRAKAEAEVASAKKASADAERPIRALAFSPDGLSLAVVTDDQIVQTYSTEDGTALDSHHSKGGAVLAVAFLGKNLLLAAGADRTIVACDFDAKWSLERVLGTGDASSPLTDRVNALAFSPDGRRLASGGGVPSRGGEIKIWDAASGKLLSSFDDVHSDSVLSLAFAPGGQLLASGAADRFMKVIDASSGKLLRSFEGHTNHVLGVCWKRDGRTLATAGADNVVKTWDLFAGQRIKTIEGFGKEVTSVHYLGDSNQLLVTCGDGTVRTVTDDGAAGRGLLAAPNFVNCAAVTPDGKIILAGGDDGLARLWSGPKPEEQNLTASVTADPARLRFKTSEMGEPASR